MDNKFILQIMAVFIALGILFLAVERADRKKYWKRMSYLLEKEWGIPTREEYSDSIMEHISYYARQNKSEYDIDEITWNDLEMDIVFQNINHTRTSAGEEYLYHLLKTTVFSEKVLEERERTVCSMEKNPEMRLQLELDLFAIGKSDKISIYEYLSRTKELKEIKKWPHILAALALLFSIVLLFFSPASAVALLFVIMISNAYFYYKEKAKIGSAFSLFQFVLGMVKQCKAMAGIQMEGCEEYFQKLKELSEKFLAFSRFHFLVSGGNSMSGNWFDAIFDYVRILFHVDLIKMATMTREIKKNEAALLELYQIVGYLDSMMAIASYRHQVKCYTVPVLRFAKDRNDCRKITAKQLYHPLLKEPVKNNLDTEKCMLLTGSNASGKSTFIKATAINAIFAQTIHTVLADAYHAPFFRVYSSMALRDDILSNESYFIVEIKSLKRIFDAVGQDEIPVLCFVDEILRGTNTVERVAASAQLLQEMAKEKVMCFAATHDIELTYLLEDSFANYHFEEVLSAEDISFDYLLKEGRANSRNALRLLQMIGFPERTIAKAQDRVTHFLKEGNWKKTE